MLYVPKGAAHGYLALADGTEALYMVTEFYAPGCEWGVRFDDPAVGVAWPDAGPLSGSRLSQWVRHAHCGIPA